MFEKVNTNPIDYLETSKAIPSSYADSLGRGISTNFLAIAGVSEALNSALAATPQEKPTVDLLHAWKQEQEVRPGASGVGFFTGDMLGFLLNPNTYAFGGAFALPAKAIGVKLGVNAASSKLAQFGVKAGVLGSEFAGQMVPQHIVENFDTDENRFDTWGISKSVGIDFGMGVAFAGVPFVWGFLRGKIGSSVAKEGAKTPDITQAHIDAALEGKYITDAEHQFASAMQRGEKPSLDIMNQIMADGKIPYDAATGHVNVSLVTPENIKSLHNTVADSLGSAVGQDVKHALNDYIIKGQLDELVKNPKMIEGLQGIVDHLDSRLALKEKYLEKYDRSIIDEYITKGLKTENPHSQQEIFNAVKKGKSLPGLLTQVPKNVRDAVEHSVKIEFLEAARKNLLKSRELLESTELDEVAGKYLEAKKSFTVGRDRGRVSGLGKKVERLKKTTETGFKEDYLEKYDSALKAVEEEIIHATGKAPKLLNPIEEMNSLRGTLTGKEFARKLMLNEDFARLTDLTNHWHNAKTLHKRVLREELYEQQAAFKNIAEMLINLSKNPDLIPGSADGVTGYLTNRIQQKVKEGLSKEKESLLKPGLTEKTPEGINKRFDDLEKMAVTEETKNMIKKARAKISELDNQEAVDAFFKCIKGVIV